MNARVDASVMQIGTVGLPSPVARCIIVIAACLCLSPMPAHAAGDDANWICWHGDAKAVVCQLSSIGIEEGDGAAELETASPAAADDPYAGLPPLARVILHEPDRLKGRRIAIPMFGEPGERAFMVELAEAVMCGAKRNCAVRFMEGGTKLALLFDELDDPALN